LFKTLRLVNISKAFLPASGLAGLA
jgi:hypothetical protein